METLIALQVLRREGGPTAVPLAEAMESLRQGKTGVVVKEDELREFLAEHDKLLATIRELQNELETRRLVERAKAYLARSLGLREDEAYRLLQKNSMDTRMPLREIAEKVLVAFNPEETGKKKAGKNSRADDTRSRHSQL